MSGKLTERQVVLIRKELEQLADVDREIIEAQDHIREVNGRIHKLKEERRAAQARLRELRAERKDLEHARIGERYGVKRQWIGMIARGEAWRSI